MGGSDDAPTVLLVDDSASVRMLCRVNLELEGFRVVEAASPSEAREQLGRGPVHVMLLDVHIGGEDGRELLRTLRSEGLAPRAALLTGSVELEAADRALADAVLTKPFQPADLVSIVRRLAGAGV